MSSLPGRVRIPGGLGATSSKHFHLASEICTEDFGGCEMKCSRWGAENTKSSWSSEVSTRQMMKTASGDIMQAPPLWYICLMMSPASRKGAEFPIQWRDFFHYFDGSGVFCGCLCPSWAKTREYNFILYFLPHWTSFQIFHIYVSFKWLLNGTCVKAAFLPWKMI